MGSVQELHCLTPFRIFFYRAIFVCVRVRARLVPTESMLALHVSVLPSYCSTAFHYFYKWCPIHGTPPLQHSGKHNAASPRRAAAHYCNRTSTTQEYSSAHRAPTLPPIRRRRPPPPLPPPPSRPPTALLMELRARIAETGGGVSPTPVGPI